MAQEALTINVLHLRTDNAIDQCIVGVMAEINSTNDAFLFYLYFFKDDYIGRLVISLTREIGDVMFGISKLLRVPPGVQVGRFKCSDHYWSRPRSFLHYSAS